MKKRAFCQCLSLLLSLCLILTIPLPALAAGESTKTWTGVQNASWTVGKNWDSGVVPAKEDSVVIVAVNTAGGNKNPLINTDVAIENLTMKSGSTCNVAGTKTAAGTLRVNGAAVIGGTLNVNQNDAESKKGAAVFGGSLVIEKDGAVNVAGSLSMNADNAAIEGKLTLKASGSIFLAGSPSEKLIGKVTAESGKSVVKQETEQDGVKGTLLTLEEADPGEPVDPAESEEVLYADFLEVTVKEPQILENGQNIYAHTLTVKESGSIDVRAGVLVCEGDKAEELKALQSAGKLFAYGGDGVLTIEEKTYGEKMYTIVTADPALEGGILDHEMQLTSGTMKLSSLQVQHGGKLEMTEGMLLVEGNQEDELRTLVDQGVIDAYGGEGSVLVTYMEEHNSTMVTATPNPGPFREEELPVNLTVIEIHAETDGTGNAYPEILEAFQKASELGGNVEIRFEKDAVYRVDNNLGFDVPEQNGTCFLLSNAKNVLINGNGAEIRLVNPRYTFLKMDGCENVYFKNLSIDFEHNTLPMTQGEILEVTGTGADTVLKVRIDDGYPGLDATYKGIPYFGSLPNNGAYVYLKDPDNQQRTLVQSANVLAAQGFQRDPEDPTGRTYLVKVPSKGSTIQPGDYFVRYHRLASGMNICNNSMRVTYDGITHYAAQGASFAPQYSDNVAFLNCRIAKRDDRLSGTGGDGILSSQGTDGIWVENCVFDNVGDDNLIAKGRTISPLRSYEKDGVLHYELIARPKTASGSGFPVLFLKAGDQIEVFKPDPDPAEARGMGVLTIQSVEEKTWQREDGAAVYYYDVVFEEDEETQKAYLYETLADVEELGVTDVASIAFGMSSEVNARFQQTPALCNLDSMGNHFVFKGNTIVTARRYGMAIMSMEGLIENNTIIESMAQAVSLHNDELNNCYVPRSIMMRYNTFYNNYRQLETAKTRDFSATVGFAIQSMNGDQVVMIDWQGIENIVFEGNTVCDWPFNEALSIRNVRGIRVVDNIFVNTGMEEKSSAQNCITVSHSSEVLIKDNVFEDRFLGERAAIGFGDAVYGAGNKVTKYPSAAPEEEDQVSQVISLGNTFQKLEENADSAKALVTTAAVNGDLVCENYASRYQRAFLADTGETLTFRAVPAAGVDAGTLRVFVNGKEIAPEEIDSGVFTVENVQPSTNILARFFSDEARITGSNYGVVLNTSEGSGTMDSPEKLVIGLPETVTEVPLDSLVLSQRARVSFFSDSAFETKLENQAVLPENNTSYFTNAGESVPVVYHAQVPSVIYVCVTSDSGENAVYYQITFETRPEDELIPPDKPSPEKPSGPVSSGGQTEDSLGSVLPGPDGEKGFVSNNSLVSDTTQDLTVDGAYQFRVTSRDGTVPVLTASGNAFRVELVSQDGNDYFFKIYTVVPGGRAEIYLNGEKLLTATATSGVLSDTTAPFTVAKGDCYQFRLTAEERPSLAAGSPSFTVVYVRNVGKDWFYKVYAVGESGDGCGFYIDGEPLPVATAIIR